MTVSVPEATYFSYVTDGATTAFSFPLRFLSADDLIVETTIGGVTSEVSHSLLTITGAGLADGGTVTFLTAPAAGTLTIRRDTAAVQTVDLDNLTKSDSNSVDIQLDRFAMVQQDRDRDLGRAWLAPVGETGGFIEAGAEGTVPKFDADGNLVEGPSAAEIESAEGYAEAAAQSATDAETAQIAAETAQGLAEDAQVAAEAAASSVSPTEYPDIATAEALTPASAPLFIRTAGYSAAGDGGGALYKKVDTEPSHDGKFSITLSDGTTVVWYEIVVDDQTTIAAFGAAFSGDESARAIAMLAAADVLRVPAGRILTCKNIELSAGQEVDVRGTLKLPDGCADLDRLLYATNADGLRIDIKEIDGNATGQSGSLGTHLIYLVTCDDAQVKVDRAHDHYINAGAAMPDTNGDGRNSSTGAIWLYRCTGSEVHVGLLTGWGREGIYLEECTGSAAWLGHAQGTGSTEYSGLQVKGENNKILRASVDNAGASGVGFDTINGSVANVLATNTRVNHGVNFGHPGFPATGSVANNIVVDGCFVSGIQVSAGTENLSISNFSVSNAGERGVQVSDSSDNIKLANGVIANSGRWNLVAGGAEVIATNVKSDDLDDRVLHLNTVTGQFVEGETVTGGTSGATGVVRKVLNNLTGAKQKLFLSSFSGTFSVAETVTGGTSAATGTTETVATPAQYLEQSGGVVVDDTRLTTSGTHRYVRHPDGTAEFWASISITGVADTDVSNVLNFVSTMTWTEAPYVQATLLSASSTSSFTLTKLQASATTSAITTVLRTSAAQVYGVSLYARGRWK